MSHPSPEKPPILLYGFHAIPKLDPRSYLLEKKLTSSPTGVVFCAKVVPPTATTPTARIALKTRLSPEMGRSADVLHEVRMNVPHPCIVQCLGAWFGELPPVAPKADRALAVAAATYSRGALHMAMEWAEGGDLLSAVRGRKCLRNPAVGAGVPSGLQAPAGAGAGPLTLFSEEVVWRWAGQLTLGIAELHGYGIIHRDIKPANCLLFLRPSYQGGGGSRGEEGGKVEDYTPTPTPTPATHPHAFDLKISDLGVARLVDVEAWEEGKGAGGGGGGRGVGGAHHNHHHPPTAAPVPDDWQGRTLWGTPLYMSPELLEPAGPSYGPATDLYSAGVTLYEVACLTPPFSGGTMGALSAAVRAGRARPLPSTFSRSLREFIASLLARDPRRRPTAREAAEVCRKALVALQEKKGGEEVGRDGIAMRRRGGGGEGEYGGGHEEGGGNARERGYIKHRAAAMVGSSPPPLPEPPRLPPRIAAQHRHPAPLPSPPPQSSERDRRRRDNHVPATPTAAAAAARAPPPQRVVASPPPPPPPNQQTFPLDAKRVIQRVVRAAAPADSAAAAHTPSSSPRRVVSVGRRGGGGGGSGSETEGEGEGEGGREGGGGRKEAVPPPPPPLPLPPQPLLSHRVVIPVANKGSLARQHVSPTRAPPISVPPQSRGERGGGGESQRVVVAVASRGLSPPPPPPLPLPPKASSPYHGEKKKAQQSLLPLPPPLPPPPPPSQSRHAATPSPSDGFDGSPRKVKVVAKVAAAASPAPPLRPLAPAPAPAPPPPPQRHRNRADEYEDELARNLEAVMRGRKRDDGVGGGGSAPPPPFPHKNSSSSSSSSSGRDYSLFGSHFNDLPSSRPLAPAFTRPPPLFDPGLGEVGREGGRGGGKEKDEEEEMEEEAARARAQLREAVEAKRRARTEAMTSRW